jgi:hypothetical protein
MIRDHPFLDVGPGPVAELYTKYLSASDPITAGSRDAGRPPWIPCVQVRSPFGDWMLREESDRRDLGHRGAIPSKLHRALPSRGDANFVFEVMFA